ncbi:arsenic transporter [Nitrosophilus labii]|uniref:arsenic transporter n=1 Tax=Nitrosophilus labii TaxID=2706014 RepID=UPI001656E0AD
MVLAVVIFLLTLIFVIWQPKGLKIGTTAVIGAVLALIFKVVSFEDVITVIDIVWDATLAFIGIIIISMILDEIGFFEWAALKMAKFSGGSGKKMFVYSLILGSIVAAFFANDGAALILTPIILSKMRVLKLDSRSIFAFVMAGGFIGDSASNPLVISNLTNIVTADYFHIGFWEYTKEMFLPNLLSIFASIIVLYLFFRKDIPKKVNINLLKNPQEAIKNRFMFKFSWIFLSFLLIGYFIGDIYHIPVSIFAFGGAIIFLIVAAKQKAIKPWLTLKMAPWQVVWFSIGLYIVVFGLKNGGLTDELTKIILYLNNLDERIAVFGVGFLSAFLSSIMNNMPTIMIMDIALDQANLQNLAYANILGCNLGPKMTPIGSLATLLWLHILANKGVKIGWGEYMKVGFIITPLVLAFSLLGLI